MVISAGLYAKISYYIYNFNSNLLIEQIAFHNKNHQQKLKKYQ